LVGKCFNFVSILHKPNFHLNSVTFGWCVKHKTSKGLGSVRIDLVETSIINRQL
jgi:hypothetical protein